MVVLAYDKRVDFVGNNIGYNRFTGQLEYLYTDNERIDIGQEVYNDFLTLEPSIYTPFGYMYAWKAQIFQDAENKTKTSSFASIPRRYKFGHICVSSNAGVVWDYPLTFEDQITPSFRANFYTDNPNPGDGFPFGTTPLGDSQVGIWTQPFLAGFNPLSWTIARASYIDFFVEKPQIYVVRIAYTGVFSFDSTNILAAAPRPFVVVYP